MMEGQVNESLEPVVEIGASLLKGYRLMIDYPGRTVRIE